MAFRHTAQALVVAWGMSAPPPPRKRPTLTVTISAGHMERLRKLVGRLPGKRSNLSGVVDEMLGMTLPMLEHAAAAFEEALRPDGSTDDDLMRDRMAAYLGQQILRFSQHNTGPKEGEDD
jgi:hypothetical protein